LAYLNVATPEKEKVASVAKFLEIVASWQARQTSAGNDDGFLSQLWYRGVSEEFSKLAPGVYRDGFTARASKLNSDKGNIEAQRLRLEREMISQFRTAGASFLGRGSLVEIYFTAQHFGMPTRLLDWSTNPLAALFFACDGARTKNGVVYAMDARKVIPLGAMKNDKERLYQSVMTMRNPYVEYTIGLSFWVTSKEHREPYVLPVRPDIIPGRIGQQGSCFTLHMHGAQPATNPTLATIVVAADRKGPIREELHRLNINEFTVYYDLDHLSKEIKRFWGV
jgi:hypothetical protein